MKDLREKAKEELSKIRFPNEWNSDSVREESNGSLERSFRDDSFYTSRRDEEDDDFPNFTGEKDVLKFLKLKLSDDVLNAFDIELYDQEKCWFSVVLVPKKDGL